MMLSHKKAAVGFCLILACSGWCQAAPPAAPTGLRCQYTINPLGIDTAQPKFSWIVNDADRNEFQTAYQLLVASRPELLENEEGDLWDSGIVKSDQQAAVLFSGRPLAGKKRYWWTVRTWDKEDAASPWSTPAWFETAMLKPSDWQAKWVGGPFRRVRKTFHAHQDKAIVQARAYVTGLGYYELHINGAKIGDYVLEPTRSRYNKGGRYKNDKPLRAMYRTYDITEQIRSGENAAGLMLGSGFFRLAHLKQYDPQASPCPKPFLCQLDIRYSDGSMDVIASDKTWKGDQGGPIVAADVWHGETYDARREDDWDQPGYDDRDWTVVTPQPSMLLTAQLTGMRIVQTLRPKAMREVEPGVFVFDLGQNIAGWCRLRVEGPSGRSVVLRFAEAAHPDGRLNPLSSSGAKAEDTYVLRGDGAETWEPRFTYHGFRYVEVKGYPGKPTLDSVTGCVVHDDVDITSRFECSHAQLNALFKMFMWSYRGNLNGVQTDCHQRAERMGWLGDALVTGDAVATYLDMTDFYARWIMHMHDCQRGDGFISDTVPSRYGGIPGHVAWKAGRLSLPWDYYMAYGDTALLSQHYETMKAFTGWLIAQANEDHTLSTEYTPYGGDHGFGGPYSKISFGDVSKQALATAYYYRCLDLMTRIAEVLERSQDAEQFRQRADCVRTVYQQRFRVQDGARVHYGGNLQTDNAIALHFDLARQEDRAAVLNSLLSDIRQRDDHQKVGILGGYSLYHALQQNGRFDVAYKLATQTTAPSFGHMLSQGATTVWVGLQYVKRPHFSLNHPMRSAGIAVWLIRGVGGISPIAPGYRQVCIAPGTADDLEWSQSSVQTIRGPVSCAWKRQQTQLTMDITVPANCTALVKIPCSNPASATIHEGGRTVVKQGQCHMVDGMEWAGAEDRFVNLKVGSGKYSFAAPTGSEQ